MHTARRRTTQLAAHAMHTPDIALHTPPTRGTDLLTRCARAQVLVAEGEDAGAGDWGSRGFRLRSPDPFHSPTRPLCRVRYSQ
eukprot:3520879-Rhodomonas_salina.3